MNNKACRGSIGLLAVGFSLVLTGNSSPPRPTYSDVVVFGESTSCDGRSNGPHWVVQLAPEVGVGTASVQAVLRATTTDVYEKQVKPYLAARGHKLCGDALYIVWAGANDLFQIRPCQEPTPIIDNAVAQIGNAVEALVRAGSRHVLVPNLPDLGQLPR